jgi:lisH domain-containing protein FOPNL
MTTLNEMKEVLKEHLEKTGTLNEIRSKLRSDIFNTLNNNGKNQQSLSNQNLIINELIREYLAFNNYNYTNSVLIPEAGQPEKPLDRKIVSSQLNLVESAETRQIPLLYSIFDLTRHSVRPQEPRRGA